MSYSTNCFVFTHNISCLIKFLALVLLSKWLIIRYNLDESICNNLYWTIMVRELVIKCCICFLSLCNFCFLFYLHTLWSLTMTLLMIFITNKTLIWTNMMMITYQIFSKNSSILTQSLQFINYKSMATYLTLPQTFSDS